MTTYYPQTVVYEEKKVTYWVLLFVLIFIGIIFLLLEYTRDSMGNLIFLPLFGLSFGIFATYNMAFYSVKIFDDKTIQFGFPNWNKKLQPSEIKSIEETPYRPMREFGGLGWRLGWRKNGKLRIGYIAWLQKGIEIEATNGKYYVFGTDNPEEILSLMQ